MKLLQSMHMLLSDLIPHTLFIIYAATNHYPTTLIGPIISRLFSLIYHGFEARHPSLLYLDYVGICTMSFSVPAACSIAEKGWGDARNICEQLNIAVAITFLFVSAELAVNCYSSKPLLFRSPEHAIIALALLGNLPIIAIITHPTFPPTTRILLSFSIASFAIGYFGLKPNHHILWHWAAAAGQAAGVLAIEWCI